MVSHHQEKFSSARPSQSPESAPVSSSVARQLAAAAAALRDSGDGLRVPLGTATSHSQLQLQSQNQPQRRRVNFTLESEEKDARVHGAEQHTHMQRDGAVEHRNMTPDATKSKTKGPKRPRKRANYLSHEQRCAIIKRVAQGEQQAALAREYGVTRAAVCHMHKHRVEILSRPIQPDPDSERHAEDEDEEFVGPPGVELMVHELRTRSTLLLLTSLRDERSSPPLFRRTAGRLIMILVEEALALLGSRPTEVVTADGYAYSGLERRYNFCGVTLSAGGYPFSVLLDQIEEDAPQGAIRVGVARDPQGQLRWRLRHLDLPATINECKVLLFSDSCSSGSAECKAIEVLCNIGVREADISLVVLVIASDGVVQITSHFPDIKILTAAIDPGLDPHTGAIVPGLGDFVTRYNGRQTRGVASE